MKNATENIQIIKYLVKKYEGNRNLLSTLIMDIKDGSYKQRADFIHLQSNLRIRNIRGRTGAPLKTNKYLKATEKVFVIEDELLKNEPQLIPIHKLGKRMLEKMAQHVDYMDIGQLKGWNKMSPKQRIIALIGNKDIPINIRADLAQLQLQEIEQ